MTVGFNAHAHVLSILEYATMSLKYTLVLLLSSLPTLGLPLLLLHFLLVLLLWSLYQMDVFSEKYQHSRRVPNGGPIRAPPPST